MDVDEPCLLKELPVNPCSADHLVSSSIVGKTLENSLIEDSGTHTLKDCTNNSEDNSKRFIKESKIHLLTDSEDSFEVFLPKKCSNVVKDAVNVKPLPGGKQKAKKTKTRSCPYFSTKSVKSYFKPPSKSQEEKDLEIALARSLLDVSGGDYPITTSNTKEVEKKSFPKGSPLKLKNWTGKESKKSKTILQRRTKEDRDRIITQKVAIVLLERKETTDDCFLKKDINLTSSVLEGYFDKDSKLWELSKLSEDSFVTDFYVESLKQFIEQPSPTFCVKEQNNISEGSSLVVEVAADMNVIHEEISKMYSSESGTTLGISSTVDNLPAEGQHPTSSSLEEVASCSKSESPNTTEYNKSKKSSYSFNNELANPIRKEPVDNNCYTRFSQPIPLKEELATSSKFESSEPPDYEYSRQSSFNELASSSKCEPPESTDYNHSLQQSSFKEFPSSSKCETPEPPDYECFLRQSPFKELAPSSKCEPPEPTDYNHSLHQSSFKEFPSSSKCETPEPPDYECSLRQSPFKELAPSSKCEPPEPTDYNYALHQSSFKEFASSPKCEASDPSDCKYTHQSSFKELNISSDQKLPEPSDYEYSQYQSPVKEITSSPKSDHPETTDYESSQKSNYFLTNFESLKLLSDNWYSLYNRKEYSDLEILLAEGDIVPGHTLVLHVRCPLLLNDMTPMLKRKVIDLSQFSQRASVVFLKYIYSGKTDAISNLTIDEKRDVTILSKKYDMSNLHTLLITETNLIEFYNQSTCEPSSESSSHFSNNIPHDSCKPKEKSKTVKEVQLGNKQHSPDTFLMAHTPEKESHDLTRPFSLFSKTVSDIFEDSCKSSSPVSKDLSTDTKHKLSNDIISLVESNSSKSTSPKRNIDSPQNDHFEFNGGYELINLADSPQPPVKKVHLLESEVITLDSDSGDAPKKSPKTDYPKESSRIYDDYDFNHYSPITFEINDNHNQLNDNESEVQIKRDKTQVGLVEDSSLHKCLQSSFPSISQVDDIELQARHKHFPSHLSSTPLSSPAATSSLKNKFSTPKEDSSIIIKDATPRANYNKMAVPELQKELRKYGLKPNLDRKKAITLLNYIYDQIHLAIEPPELFPPSIPSSSRANQLNLHSSSRPVSPISPNVKSRGNGPSHLESGQVIPPIPSTSKENPSRYVNVFPSTSRSYDKESSDDSCEDEQSNEFALEEAIFNESKKEESPSEVEPSSLKQIIANFLKSDGDLFTSVVTFEPLLLNTFHKTLKDHGVRCSISDLMDTLDELCVNYRIEKRQKIGGKSRKRKRGVRKILNT